MSKRATVVLSFFVFVIGFLPIPASAAEWELTIVYPDQEKKVYDVPNENWKPVIKGTAWKCAFTEEAIVPRSDNGGFARSIDCSNGNVGVSLFMSCYRGNLYTPENWLTLLDVVNKKTRRYSLRISCKP